MSTSKHIDKIGILSIILAILLLIISYLLLTDNSDYNSNLEYPDKIFDVNKVHTINIIMDDWDEFIDTCESEEYSLCDIEVDGELFKNVAIRAKGNTSLSHVSTINSNRYSFKIEFDHYKDSNTYYGLDKLCLNNLIQDKTFMKDHIVYSLMNEFGVDAPLSSYVQLFINNTEFGLYLGVEAIEDSYKLRVNNVGNLYKPDMMEIGAKPMGERIEPPGYRLNESNHIGIAGIPNNPGMRNNGEMGEMSDKPDKPDKSDKLDKPDKLDKSDKPDKSDKLDKLDKLDKPDKPDKLDKPDKPDKLDKPDNNEATQEFNRQSGSNSKESPVTKLQYIDDNISSYSDIFDSAKTDITNLDKQRLISSLKTLSLNNNIESVLEIEDLIRYFVVHNYVVNGDSYTGSMIHNYYLSETNGKLKLIPWDYNLAFGAFGGGFGSGAGENFGDKPETSMRAPMEKDEHGLNKPQDATSVINDPIDTPLSVIGDGDRPLVDWILSEKYKSVYHGYLLDFISNTDIESLILDTKELIAPYIESDPTKFFTYEEFIKATDSLVEFCDLRTKSILGQLNGEIPSTSEGQDKDSSNLIKADELELNDMGEMEFERLGDIDLNSNRELLNYLVGRVL